MAHIDLPSPPFIHVPGLANLRDAGGYAIEGQPGKVIRRGILYRSADLTKLEDEGVALLRPLGITHVFDLRSVTELAKNGNHPPKTWEGAARVFVPVFLDKDYSPEALAARFRDYSDGPTVSRYAHSSYLGSCCGRGPLLLQRAHKAGLQEVWRGAMLGIKERGQICTGYVVHTVARAHPAHTTTTTTTLSETAEGFWDWHTPTPSHPADTRRFPSCMSPTDTDN